MFGAGRSGSHLINLRRKTCGKKIPPKSSTNSLDSTSAADNENPPTTPGVRRYTIPNFAEFEFYPIKQESYEKGQVKFKKCITNYSHLCSIQYNRNVV